MLIFGDTFGSTMVVRGALHIYIYMNVAGLCFCFLLLFYFFPSPPIRLGEAFSSVIFSSLSLLLFVFLDAAMVWKKSLTRGHSVTCGPSCRVKFRFLQTPTMFDGVSLACIIFGFLVDFPCARFENTWSATTVS